MGGLLGEISGERLLHMVLTNDQIMPKKELYKCIFQ